MDKAKTSFPIPITFAEGEQPTNKKLNAGFKQAKNSSAILESLVGDLWNQSGDAVTSPYPNKITNLARTIGSQDLLASQFCKPDFTGTTSVRIRQPISSFYNLSEIPLSYKGVSNAVITASVAALKNSAGNNYSASASVSVAGIQSDTSWFFDSSTSKLYLGRALSSTQTQDYLEYEVLAADFPSDTDNSFGFNVIPSENQSDWKGLKIVQVSSGKYLICLPFRRPLTSDTGLSKIPVELNNVAELASPSVIRYWGPPTAGYSYTSGISNNRFYRYTFNEIIQSLFVSPVSGKTISSGLIYLWDNTTSTIIEGLTFKVPEVPMTVFGGQVPFVIQVEGAILDSLFSGYTSSGSTEAVADYTLANRFRIICPSVSIAQAISSLRKTIIQGDKTTGISNFISHSKLININPTQSARHVVNFPSTWIDNDSHPYLLSRMGSVDSGSTSLMRDRYNNAMLGDLLMASSSTTSSYQNLNDPSKAIYFGRHSTGAPKIRNVPADSLVAQTGAQSSLEISNSTLSVTSGTTKFATNYIRQNGNSLALFDSAGDANGRLFIKRLLLNGSSQQLSNFDGTIQTAASYLDINMESAYPVMTFRGSGVSNYLDISATAAITAEVVVGLSNANTFLRVASNVLLFGLGADGVNTGIQYSPGSKTYYFASNNSATDTTVIAGYLGAVNEIEAGAHVGSGSSKFVFGLTSTSPRFQLYDGNVYLVSGTTAESQWGNGGNEWNVATPPSHVARTYIARGGLSSDFYSQSGGVDVDSVKSDSYTFRTAKTRTVKGLFTQAYYNDAADFLLSTPNDVAWRIGSESAAGGQRGGGLEVSNNAGSARTGYLFSIMLYPFVPVGATVTAISVYGAKTNGTSPTLQFRYQDSLNASGTIPSLSKTFDDTGSDSATFVSSLTPQNPTTTESCIEVHADAMTSISSVILYRFHVTYTYPGL